MYSMQKIKDVNITIVQPNLMWENINGNLQHLEEIIDPINNTNLIVLPEMFNTSYTLNTALAEDMRGGTVDWMKKIAITKKIAVCGSLILKENDNYYNRLVWVAKNGEVFCYNKKHLFSLSKENRCFTPGKEKLIVELNGWKICPLICYDLRFPAWCRYNNDYDCLIFIASWPTKRIKAWQTLLKARAIENMSYVIGVNRVGVDGNNISFNGQSCLINPLGKKYFEAKEKELIKTISLSYSEIQKARRIYGFLDDKDNFEFVL